MRDRFYTLQVLDVGCDFAGYLYKDLLYYYPYWTSDALCFCCIYYFLQWVFQLSFLYFFGNTWLCHRVLILNFGLCFVQEVFNVKYFCALLGRSYIPSISTFTSIILLCRLMRLDKKKFFSWELTDEGDSWYTLMRRRCYATQVLVELDSVHPCYVGI